MSAIIIGNDKNLFQNEKKGKNKTNINAYTLDFVIRVDVMNQD